MKESGENIRKDVLGYRVKGKFYQQSLLGEGNIKYWLTPLPPFPPPSSCKPFLSKQLTIFKLQKQVNILSLREHDSFFGKSPLRP